MWRCMNCACLNTGSRCHSCGSLEDTDGQLAGGPWIFDDVCLEQAGITRWLRDSARFEEERHGEDTFCLAHLPEDVRRGVIEPGSARIRPVIRGAVVTRYAFGRLSTESVAATLRIHTDAGMGTDLAWVWYGGQAMTEESGTAFFRHAVHGRSFRGRDDPEEHDRLLREASSDLSQWTRYWIAPMEPNRLVVYPASLFHARWPAAGWGRDQRDGRGVIVGFCDRETG